MPKEIFCVVLGGAGRWGGGGGGGGGVGGGWARQLFCIVCVVSQNVKAATVSSSLLRSGNKMSWSEVITVKSHSFFALCFLSLHSSTFLCHVTSVMCFWHRSTPPSTVCCSSAAHRGAENTQHRSQVPAALWVTLIRRKGREREGGRGRERKEGEGGTEEREGREREGEKEGERG